jgi:hypothetical protein
VVAKITYPDDLMNALNYHEKKVQKGKAEGLHAENFLLEMNQLNFYDKMDRFANQMALNTRVEKKLLHVSLNFHPSEHFSKEELTQIAMIYMEKIGFGEQPYLVYQHDDAGHPHIHVLTTTIRHDGEHIHTHNIGINESSKARVEIEQEFGLVKAAGRGKGQSKYIQSDDRPPKVIYGESETKRSIINVLDWSLNRSSFTSLDELNAILKEFNVLADRGQEGGRIYKTNGLVYRVLKENGEKVGVPIKASSIYSHPTLANLEIKFMENEQARQSNEKLQPIIEKALEKSKSIEQLVDELKKAKVETLLWKNGQGFIYGITFIHNNIKINGRRLGKQFSAAAIQLKLTEQAEPGNILPSSKVIPQDHDNENLKTPQRASRKGETDLPDNKNQIEKKDNKTSKDKNESLSADMLQQLFQAEKANNFIPFELRKKKKKKKKPKL